MILFKRLLRLLPILAIIVFLTSPACASVTELPQELKTFWEARLNELSKVAPEYETTKIVTKGGIKSYEVTFKSYDNVRIHGFVAMPSWVKKGEQLRTILLLHGYGDYGRPEWAKKFAKRGFLAFAIDVRGHGKFKSSYNPSEEDLIVKGIDKPETYFLVGVLLDAIRAIDYLKTVPEVGNIYLNGTSMGGGTSMMVSVLDDRVTAIAAGVPFLNDVPLGVDTADGGPYPIVRKYCEKKSKTIALTTMNYVDVINYAPYMKKPVLIGIGGSDTICPEKGIQNVIDKIPAATNKKIIRNEKAGHVVLPGWHEEVEKWFKVNK